MGNQLADRGVISAPLPMIKLPQLNNRRKRVLSDEEEVKLLEAALQDSNPYVWLFIRIGLGTSLRHAEILSARFDGLEAKRYRLRVHVKGGDLREQPLSRELTEILNRERSMADDPDGWIFPNPSSATGRVGSMKKAFRRCAVRAGLDPSEVVPHSMRHTAITNMAAIGADVRTIQEFSGHKSIQMVMRYTHARDQRVNQAVENMEAAKTKVERIAPPKERIS